MNSSIIIAEKGKTYRRMERKNNRHIFNEIGEKKISRKEAIKKAGYAAFSAATMMLLLNNPAKGQGDSHSPQRPGDWDEWDWD